MKVIKLNDADETEVRRRTYRKHEIVIWTWKTRGFRLPVKQAEVRDSNGWSKQLHCKSSNDASFAKWKSNAELFRLGVEAIREKLGA